MNESKPTEGPTVEARLPGGGSVRIRLAERPSDGIGSVGLRDSLDFDEALDNLGRLAVALREKLDIVMPTKATVEFSVGFTMQAGKLTTLVVDGKGEASLTIALEWERG